VDDLVPLWGRKMGTPRSREARSAEWVLAALSDFNAQIQARDVVTFVNEAARRSVEDARWPDRLLAPQAMRDALQACSDLKIREIEDENPPLRLLFERMRGLPTEKKRQPYRPEDVELASSEIETLETNGVVFRDGDEYYMPEIFRLGLGFVNPSRAGILRLARRARG
jgi:hypothetical protein